MGGHDSKAHAWFLSEPAREQLTMLLHDGQAGTQQRHATVAEALTALEELRAAYFAGEALNQRNPAAAPTPAKTLRLIDNALRAMNALEHGADADTLAVVRPHSPPLRQALKDRRDVFIAWNLARKRGIPTCDGQSARKVDGRAERMRLLCGYIAQVWAQAALNPSNRKNRRQFAVKFMEAAGINHPGASHPKMLDDWLDTPVGPMPQGFHEAAAEQARAIIAPPKLATK